MFTLDHVVIAVADLDTATAAYGALLGRAPSWHGRHPDLGTRNTLFRLDNAYLELLADAQPGTAGFVGQALSGRKERPLALALRTPDLDRAIANLRGKGLVVTDPMDGHGADDAGGRGRTWSSALVDRDTAGGLRLLIIRHTTALETLPPAPDTSGNGTACERIDHVVLFTRDIESAERLWTEALGLGVAWRRDFPERGTRNVGLGLGDVVIELIMRTDGSGPHRPQQLWGIAYGVADCDGAVARARDGGVSVGDARPGLFPGTRVANVRWDRTPTLLLAKLPGGRERALNPGGAPEETPTRP